MRSLLACRLGHSLHRRGPAFAPRLFDAFHAPLNSNASVRPVKRSYASVVASSSIEKPSHYGQPMTASHPHLFGSSKELTPGITSQEYEMRRDLLMKNLPENSVVISVAAPVKYMSQAIFYKYRQASDFWYLTGFNEPDSAIILEKDSSRRGYRMTLFCKDRNPEEELWSGPRTGVEAAQSLFGADEARDIKHFTSHLKSIVSSYSHVYVDVPALRNRHRRSILNYLTSNSNTTSEYDSIIESLSTHRRKALSPQVFRLRSIKSRAEQRLLRQSADISGTAFAKTMRFTEPGQSEAHLAAHFEYLCALEGCQRPAYVPVVASGANALIIHYTANDNLLQDGELVLVDAGGEYNGYASDITRTWPVSGRFTGPQRELYQAVLNAQKACISLCTEDQNFSLHDLHRKSVQLLSQELNRIGFHLRTGDVERILYPHFLSHPIGIDLHESSSERHLGIMSGMVITIEPGIYVPPDPAFPKHFHNIGIRIEDEVLVQKDHCVVLTVNAPKEIADVEGACQGLLETKSS